MDKLLTFMIEALLIVLLSGAICSVIGLFIWALIEYIGSVRRPISNVLVIYTNWKICRDYRRKKKLELKQTMKCMRCAYYNGQYNLKQIPYIKPRRLEK